MQVFRYHTVGCYIGFTPEQLNIAILFHMPIYDGLLIIQKVSVTYLYPLPSHFKLAVYGRWNPLTFDVNSLLTENYTGNLYNG